MITSTHILLAMASLTKRDDKKRNAIVFFGSLLPDLAVFLWYPYQKLVNGVADREIWRELYFEPPMQNLIAWFNSIPIFVALAVIGYIARAKRWGTLLLVFSLAALIHISTDMPVHAEDAYRHLWPLSDWRFHSPFSYWDHNHHAGWVNKIDIALAVGSAAVLWQRFPTRWVKITLSITLAFYAYVLARSFGMG